MNKQYQQKTSAITDDELEANMCIKKYSAMNMSATPLLGDHGMIIITITLTQRCLIVLLDHNLRRWPNINTTLDYVYHVDRFSIV